MIPHLPGRHNKLSWLGLYLVTFYALWSAWAFLLVRHPELNEPPLLRAGVRLALWLGPAFLFVRLTEGPPVLRHVGFYPGWREGVLLGLPGVALILVMFLASHGFGYYRIRTPDSAAWLNPILTAPLAEEVVFRGVVFRVLQQHWGFWRAALTSALLFALIHAPYWWLSGDKRGHALLVPLCQMAAYGLLFACLFRWSRSLWSPLVCHWFNNLLNTLA